MPDSALPYQATIRSLDVTNAFLSINYSADSTIADPNRPDIVRNIRITPSNLSDSYIQSVIKSNFSVVRNKWDQLAADAYAIDSIGFNDSGYVGTEYNFKYKPIVYDSAPSINDQTQKLVAYDSEGEDEIRYSYSVVALTGTERRELREGYSTSREAFWSKMKSEGQLVRINRAVHHGDEVHASWDASNGASFDSVNDVIHSYNVSNVQRVGAGIYRVIFEEPFADTNYTVTTGVGGEDYSGAGASPRQTAVFSRATDSLQVICERTDDAVNEDNFYISVSVNKNGARDSAEVDLWTSPSYTWTSAIINETKSILGYSDDSSGDSDYYTYLNS